MKYTVYKANYNFLNILKINKLHLLYFTMANHQKDFLFVLIKSLSKV